MQTQDTPAELIIKFWPWLEANRRRLIVIGAGLLVVCLAWFFMAKQREQAEITAGQDFTVFQMSQAPNVTPQQLADGYKKIAIKYSGTMAGQRAWLQAGATLFGGGRYAEAQQMFQEFIKSEGGSPLIAQAKVGLAASLEAQGKLDEALTAYRAAAAGRSDSLDVVMAKFSQGRVLELQGKLSEAVTSYQEVSRLPLAGSLASEAAQRAALLQAKLASVKPAAKS